MQGKALPEPNAMTPVYVGIDVSKAFLDVYLDPSAETLRVSNGIKRLKRRLAGLDGVHVIMEATGKYHRAVWRSLSADGVPVTITDPLRARLFAKACGYLAKTDKLDARLPARMGSVLQPAATLEALQELVNAYAAATTDSTALANRRTAAQSAVLRSELSRLRAVVERHIQRLEAEIERLIRANPELLRRQTILLSIPGVGPVTAAALIAGLAELGTCSSKRVAMLAGLAPIACDSGERNGRRAAQSRAQRPLHGFPLGEPLQSRSRSLCRQARKEGQRGQSCPYRRHAKARRAGQHAHCTKPPLEPYRTLTSNTDAHLIAFFPNVQARSGRHQPSAPSTGSGSPGVRRFDRPLLTPQGAKGR
jgi:transposase